MHKKLFVAVAALTVVAAFAVQHRRRRALGRQLAASELERLAVQRSTAAREAVVQAAVDQLCAELRVVADAAEVVDRAWARSTGKEGSA